jgi:RNA polymerase sigma-70 factor (ECF subfamily)
MPERDEGALVARAVRGDVSAFEELIQPYAGRLYRTVLGIVGNPADAADAYQDATLAAFEKLAHFRGAAAFGTWWYRIAVNYALMRRRAAARSAVIAEEDLPRFNWMGMHAQPVHDWAESAEVPAYRAELRAALIRALDGLPALDRTIVWLKDAEGASHEEIAAATGLSVIAARTRLHRARQSLRTQLQRYVGGAT